MYIAQLMGQVYFKHILFAQMCKKDNGARDC